MLLGRRRRYFGYPKDTAAFIETPESAKSYASHLSSAPSFTGARICNRKQEIKPDTALPRRYADRNLHHAIATQIPALLPPLKNTFRFQEIEDRPITFHNPQLEHHFERSLYYIWLSKNDRKELCQIVDAHLGSRGRGQKHPGDAGAEYREIGNPIQRPPPVDYTAMPRNLSVLDDTSPTSKSMKSKFQKGIWDPPKTPRDKFVRDHGKSPAMDAICHEYPGNMVTRVNEKDIQDCLLAARKLLGPYAGLNSNMGSHDDIPDELWELIKQNNAIEKEDLDKKKQMGLTKRPFGYNSSQIKYEKQIASAVDYYNKIKRGVRNPTPPTEIFGSLKKYQLKGAAKSLAKIMVQEETDKRQSVKDGASTAGAKRKFNKNNITEEDYMDLYLHYLGSDVDVGLKKPIRSLTDITKLRKKMHLDSEQSIDEEINELIRNDSFSDIKDKVKRRILKGQINPHPKKKTPSSDIEEEEQEDEEIDDSKIMKDILVSHYEKLKSPKMREVFSKFSKASMGVPSSTVTMASTPTMNLEDEDKEMDDDEKLEKEFGASFKEVDEVLSEMQVPSTLNDSVMNASIVSSSDSNSSSLNAASVEIPPGQTCNHTDLECLSKAGALGTPPFGSGRKQKISESMIQIHKLAQHGRDYEELEHNIFAKEHWKPEQATGKKATK